MDQATLPQRLVSQAQGLDRRKVALREKKYGIWQEVTWAQYAAHVRAVGLGLAQLLGQLHRSHHPQRRP